MALGDPGPSPTTTSKVIIIKNKLYFASWYLQVHVYIVLCHPRMENNDNSQNVLLYCI